MKLINEVPIRNNKKIYSFRLDESPVDFCKRVCVYLMYDISYIETTIDGEVMRPDKRTKYPDKNEFLRWLEDDNQNNANTYWFVGRYNNSVEIEILVKKKFNEIRLVCPNGFSKYESMLEEIMRA